MCGGGDNKPQQTAAEKELAQIAIEKWNSNMDTYYDLQNQYIKDVQMGESDFEEGRGRAASANNMAFSDARDRVDESLTSRGVAPDSGQYVSALSKLSEDKGVATGTGINEAETEIDNAHLGGLQSVVDMGLGEESQAYKGMGDVAADSTMDSIERANRAFNRSAARQQFVGTLAGAGAQYMGRGGSARQPKLPNNTAYVKNF